MAKQPTHMGILVVRTDNSTIRIKAWLRETPKYWINCSGTRFSKEKHGRCAKLLGVKLDLLTVRRAKWDPDRELD